MKSGLRWMLLPAIALALTSCAAPYAGGYGGGYYGGYADYAYPDDFYGPTYGGIVFGDGWHHDGGHWADHDGHHFAGAVHAGGWHGGMAGHGGHGGGHRG
jgi:hypothetical protein